MAGLQAVKRVFACFDDMVTTGALPVGLVAHLALHYRGQNNLIALAILL